MQAAKRASPELRDILSRRLIFVGGKGGVGKTVVSQAIAHCLPGRVLWVAFEDPILSAGKTEKIGPSLWRLNCESVTAFEEYVTLKIGPTIAQVFLKNRLIRYLGQAAPGIHELVLLGKVWYERLHYDHVVCDMPSTGYGLAMFQSTENFSNLFRGGPVHRDAEAMQETFRDSGQSGHLIVSLPEEMPLIESIELRDFLAGLFPNNTPRLIANRLFPAAATAPPTTRKSSESSDVILSKNATDYLASRRQLERENLKLWSDLGITFDAIDYVPPAWGQASVSVVDQIVAALKTTGWGTPP